VSPDPDSDEILDNCNAVTTILTAILQLIAALTSTTPDKSPADCCAKLVAALFAVNQALSSIAINVNAIAIANGGKPIDLDPLVDAVKQLDADLSAYLARIANAFDKPLNLAPLPPFTVPMQPKDLSSLVDAILRQMIIDGRIDAQIGQMLTS